MPHARNKILITGGAGFIGSHLSESLLKMGREVVIVDNLSTGSIDNIQGFKENPRFKYFIEDVENTQLLKELVDSADCIVHLAASVGVLNIINSPIKTIENNIVGTDIILKLCAKKGKRLIVASTSEVYGKSEKFPFGEGDDLILGPSNKGRWSYACSKLIDEFLSIAYFKEQGLPVTVLRLFNTVGPRQTGRYGMVIPSFAKQALQGTSITVFGDGKQKRCFAHVHDVVEGISKVMESANTVGEVINLGNSTNEITILDLAKKIVEKTKSSSAIKLVPYAEAYAEGFEDMYRRVPDLSKAYKLFKFKPSRTLDEIINDVVEFERKRKTAA